MNPVYEWGLDLIRAVQGFFGPGSEAVFEAITSLGGQEFFLLLIPLLMWAVDFNQGARLGLLLLASGFLNAGLKEILMNPRPCVFEPQVCISDSYGYGLPSGHSQTAVVVWGMLARWAQQTWVWVGAAVLMFLMGLSRVYLGVHFPTDVLGGWTLGIVVLLGYARFGKQIENSIRGLSLTNQIVLVIAVALLFSALWPVADIVASMATLAGVGVGLALAARNMPFDASGPIWQRAVRYVLGMIVAGGLFFGLNMLFPTEGESLYVPLRFVRYGLVGIWISFGGPRMFRLLGLASNSQRDVLQGS